eukprot:m.51001 g.51001  ORF g.51001 m.51001 type:complete len:242 (+) comp11638_c1_seq2:79-804(+)
MSAEIAAELLRELKRCPPHTLPPYNAENLRKVLQEMNDIYRDAQSSRHLTSDDYNARRAIQRDTIFRNKRCALAYLVHRMSMIRHQRLLVGAALPDDWREAMSAEELLSLSLPLRQQEDHAQYGQHTHSTNYSPTYIVTHVPRHSLTDSLTLSLTLSPQQEDHAQYGQLLTLYFKAMKHDLTAFLEPPRDDIIIQVRVVREFGELTTETGATLLLTLGTQHSVNRTDVDLLIRQGYLQVVA